MQLHPSELTLYTPARFFFAPAILIRPSRDSPSPTADQRRRD